MWECNIVKLESWQSLHVGMIVWWGAEPSNQAVSLCMIVTDSRCQKISVLYWYSILAFVGIAWLQSATSGGAAGHVETIIFPRSVVHCLTMDGGRERVSPGLLCNEGSIVLAHSLLLPLFVGKVVFVGAAFCTDDDGYHSPRKVWECQKTLVLVLR